MAEPDATNTVLAVEVRKIIFKRAALGLGTTGAIVFLTFYCVAVFVDKPPRLRKGHWPYIATLVLICIMHIIVASLTCLLFYELMFDPKAAGESIFMFEDLNAQNLTFRHWTTDVTQGMLVVALWIVDGILMVRCYIMYNDKRWVCIFPGLIYLASIGLGAAWTAVLTKAGNRPVKISWSLMSVLFNMTVTGLIGTRLVLANRDLRAASPMSGIKLFSRPTRLLIDSALPTSILGIVVIILFAAPKPTSLEGILAQRHYLDFLNVLYFEVAVVSPLLIIFRVMTGQTWARSTNESSISTGMSFGTRSRRRDDQSTFVLSSRSQGSTRPSDTTSFARDDTKGVDESDLSGNFMESERRVKIVTVDQSSEA